MAGDRPLLRCPTCSARFAKADHLARHELSHGNERPYICQFCSLGFNRRDALLRHWRTCDERLKSGLPPPVLPSKKRGRKPNACTRCAQQKKKCSGSLPCATCAEQSQQCIYARPPTTKGTMSAEREERVTAPQVLDAERDSSNSMEQALETVMPDAQSFWAHLANEVASDLWPSPTPLSSATSVTNYPTQVDCFAASFSAQDNFSHVSSDAPNNGAVFDFASDMSNISQVPMPLAPKQSFLHLNIRFLANFTATHGMASSFEIGNSLARRRAMSALVQNPNSLSPSQSYGSGPGTAGFTNLWLGPSRGVERSSLESSRFNPGYASQQPGDGNRGSDQQPLAPKSREIVQGIQGAICSKMPYRITTTNWSQSAERSCARFFSPLNIERFIGAFWHLWHPNWPVFHRPTFKAVQKPPQLIAALSLIGACMSPEKSDRDQAMSWLEAVEDWVFSDPDFSEDAIPQIDDESQLSQIETRLDSIRAAYAVLLIMIWEGSERQVARGRRTRFTQVVSISRSLYFFCTAPDPAYDELGPGSSRFCKWMLYALREECVRTLMYVFLIDCAFVMFNNSAPRMVISELQFGLVSPDPWFHAPDPDKWSVSVERWPQVGQGLSLSQAVGLMMQSDLDAKQWKIFEQTNLINHFAITSGFHNLVFYHRYGVDGGSKSSPLSRGLRNWIQIWSNRSSTAAGDGSSEPETYIGGERIGFYRYTREFWCLAVILYCQIHHDRSIDVNSDLAGSRRQGRALRTFDDSDMGQVHELIVQFREMDLREVLVE